MNSSEFRLNIISALNKQLSRKQIKSDIKALDDSLYVKVIAKLSTALSKRQIKSDLKQLNQLNVQVGASLKVSSAQKKDIQKQIKRLQSELGNLQLKIGVKNSGSSAKSTATLRSIHSQAQSIKSDLKAVDEIGTTLGSTLKSGLSKVLGSLGKINVISQLNQHLRNAWTEAQTLDDSLVDLQKVTDEITDRNALYKYFDGAMSKAQDLNVKVNSLIYAITEFKKLGWSLSDAELGAKWSTILENVGDTNIDTAIGSIKTAIASFDKIGGYGNDQLDKKLEAYVDIINNMSNRYSVDAEGLVEAIRLSAGTLTEAHTSIEQAATIFSTANKYYNDPSYLGNTVKIGSLRMRASEGDGDALSELEDMGEDIDSLAEATSSLREQLLALTGVDIMVDEHTFKSYYDQLYEISQVIDNLNDTSRANVLETLFGKNRSAAGAAILSGMKESADAYKDAINSAGSATAEYEIWMESADAASRRFANNVTKTYQSIISGNTVRDLTNLSSAVLEFANSWGIVEGTFRGFLTLGILKGITSLTVAFKNSAVQISNYGTALNTVRDMSTMTKGTVKYKDALNVLKKSCVTLTDAQLQQVLANNMLGDTERIKILRYQGLTEAQAKAKLEQLGLIQTTNAQTAATFSLKGAITGLGETIRTTFFSNPIGFILMGATAVVSFATSVLNKHKQSIEEARQAAEEAANTYKESTSSIDDYVSKYQELRQALIAAKGNEEETYNVKKQLLELQNELNEKFGDEYGKLNLVTDAYKDQTEAIKAYNKEAANTFLNENEDGIRRATNKMTKDSHYSLGYADVVDVDANKALHDIINKYSDQGMYTTGDSFSGQLYIHLEADPQSAYDTINAFETDVRNKAEELGDEHMFADILDISSDSLNDAKSIIDEWGEIYRQSLLANIAKDDTLSEGYNKAIDAVEAYNEAVLQSEDPYSDENVAKARQNLQSIREELSGEDWEKYGSVVQDVFEQADTSVYDFNQALKNDEGLKTLSEDLKGLSNLDLQSLNLGENASFDKLKESAEECGISAENLIDALVRLGFVQDKIVSDAPEIEEPKWDYSTTIENLDKVKEKLTTLDQSFAKLFDKDEQIGFEDLSSIHGAFSDLGGIDDYIKRIQEAGQDTEQVSQIFGELTGAYLDHIGVLSNVTEENKDLIISMLEEMGIANAEEIVFASLGQTAETYALQKQFLTEKGYELVNATLEEITQFLNEVDASDQAKQALAQLALAKFDVNNTTIDTSADIDNVIALANAAGASMEAIAKFKNAMATIENAKTNPVNGVGGLKQLDYATMLKDSVENSTYDWQFQKLDASQFKINSSPKYTPKYTGGSNTSNAIEQAAKDAEKASKEAEKQFEETIDFFERRVKVLTDAFENLEKGIENVIGADAKNTLLSAQIGILDEEINNYTDALAMYKAKASDALSGIDSDLRDKIVNGAVSITDFIGDGNEDVVEAMKDYEGWADKVAECTQELESLKTQIRQLELQKFNNIIEDFTNQFDIHDDAIDLISKRIGVLEEAGELVGESYYSKQIEQSQKQLNVLEAEKVKLVEQLSDAISSGRIQKGTDEWLEMTSALSDVEGNILDCKTAIEEFNNELLDLNWKIFERVQDEFSNLNSEMENLVGLFDDFNEIKVSDGKGTWTRQAIATLGLYAQQYELARYQVGQYDYAIENLKQDYLDGKYSATEYMDKLAELSEQQWDAVNSAESLEDAIVSLNETRVNEEIKVIEDEIDAYKELVDAEIDALEAAKDLHDYEQSIAEKTKSITDIERQLTAMQNDNTASTVAKRKQLEEQLAEAKKALVETEYDHSIEAQKDALNQQYQDFEDARNAEIEALKLTLEDRELLISQSFETVKANADTVGQEIAMIATEHGVTVSDALISSWQSGENAIASYGAVLTEQSSAFIGNIIGVQDYVYGLQAQANSAADSLAYMFSTRADTLVNELTSSYSSESNLNAMTNTLQNSLVDTLERGYNISSIENALSSIASGADSVASAANRAAQALASMGAAQTSAGTSDGGKYAVVLNGQRQTSFFSSKQEAEDWIDKTGAPRSYYYVAKYAKGGIITKDDKNPFNNIAKSLGEDVTIVAKEGESVLTPDQTEGLVRLAPLLEDAKEGIDNNNVKTPENNNGEVILSDGTVLVPIDPDLQLKFDEAFNNFKQVWNVPDFSPQYKIPEVTRIEQPSVNIEKMVEINAGDINDTNHFIKQISNFVNKETTQMLNDINTNFKYSRRR